MFKTDRGKERLKTRANSNNKTNGKKIIVVGGTKRNTIIKIPNTMSSKINISEEVIVELMDGISLLK